LRREAPAATLDRTSTTPTRIGAFVATLLAFATIGFAVRLLLAAGPLWRDEIWSIDNLAPLTHSWQAFWRISHDNNHFLNSIWLDWAIAFSTNPIVLRAPSILMGAATIVVMAKLGRRSSLPAALAAAALTAFSYFFVNYSVEARGYAGEALTLAIAFDALERALDEPRSNARYVLAAAAGVGMFWHLATLAGVALFALVALAAQRRRGDSWAAAVKKTERLFAPTAIAILPALGCVMAGIIITGRFSVGGLNPFSLATALDALATVLRDTLGLPPETPTLLAVSLWLAMVGLALAVRSLSKDRRLAYAIILIAAPLAVLVLRPGNADFPRYYLVCALFLILMAADLFGVAWRLGGWRRLAAAVILCAALVGDAALLTRYQASKATAWPQALEAIEDSGDRVVASSFDEGIGRLIAYFNRDHSPPIVLTPLGQFRQAQPRWLIVETSDIDSEPRSLELGSACPMRFDFAGAYESWGLSAIRWRLYRRADPSMNSCQTR